MQTLWSRANQARLLCNCPACISSTNGLTRRATASTARRGVQIGNAFALFSSSLAASAALADSRNKAQRREQLDNAIVRTRAEVEATEAQQQLRLATLSHDSGKEEVEDSSLDESWSSILGDPIEAVEDSYNQKERYQTRKDSWEGIFDWATQQDSIRATSGFQGWKGPPLSLLLRLRTDELQQLIANDRLRRAFYGGPDSDNPDDGQYRGITGQKKLRTLEWSVAKLTLVLMLHCSEDALGSGKNFCSVATIPSNSKDIQTHETAPLNFQYPVCHQNSEEAGEGSSSRRIMPGKDSLEEPLKPDYSVERQNMYTRLAEINQQISSLHLISDTDEFFRSFPSPHRPDYREVLIDQNDELAALAPVVYDLLRQMTGGSLDAFIPKICYNLLTSRSPPNIYVYNMLLIRFAQLGNTSLVQAVLDSILESHIRPNEITHSTLLRFFTVTEDGYKFWKYTLRLMGAKGGIACVRPGSAILPILVDQHHFCGNGNAKAKPMARMNGEVYNAVIVGALRFNDNRKAMYFYQKMISEGWGPSIEILNAILQRCFHDLDWDSGVAVWNQILALGKKANTLAYEWMLRLCKCCRKHHIFHEVLHNGVHHGFFSSAALEEPDLLEIEDVDALMKDLTRAQTSKFPTSINTRKDQIKKLLTDKSTFALENILRKCRSDVDLHAKLARLEAKAAEIQGRERIYLTRLSKIAEEIESTARSVDQPSRWSITTELSRMFGALEKEAKDAKDSTNQAHYWRYKSVVQKITARLDQEGTELPPVGISTSSPALKEKLPTHNSADITRALAPAQRRRLPTLAKTRGPSSIVYHSNNALWNDAESLFAVAA